MESSEALRAAAAPLWRGAGRTTASAVSRGADVAFGLLLAVFVATRLWGLTKYSLWYDEIFSLAVADDGWQAMLGRVVRDVVHPPLFYATLKLWMDVGGTSVAWLRLLPALVAVASILPFTLLCRELRFTTTQTNVALSLLALNGFLVDYAHELRMYSMLVFFTLASLALFARLLRADGSRVLGATAALGVVNVLLVYTQYFGWAVVGAEGLFVLLWRRDRLRALSLSVAVVAACFAPWAYAVGRVAARREGLSRILDWLPRPELRDAAHYFAMVSGPLDVRGGLALGLALAAAPIAVAWWRIGREHGEGARDRADAFRLLALASLAPPTVTFAASHVLAHSVWAERYLIVSAAPFLIWVAFCVGELRPARLRAVAATLVVGWAALSGAREISRTDRKVPWQSLAHHIVTVEGSRPGPIPVYMFNWILATPLRFYLAERPGQFHVRLVEDLADIRGDHFWVVYSRASVPASFDPRRLLAAKGFTVGDAVSAASVGDETVLLPVWAGPPR